MAKKMGYKDSSAKSYNDKYMSKGMGRGDLGQASKPKICNVPVGTGYAGVSSYNPGNMGYPSQAFDYNY